MKEMWGYNGRVHSLGCPEQLGRECKGWRGASDTHLHLLLPSRAAPPPIHTTSPTSLLQAGTAHSLASGTTSFR